MRLYEHFYKVCLILLLLACPTLRAGAQTLNFRQLTVNDGLLSSTVYFTYQDSRGFMWFATESGINRYDGSKFESFSIDDGLSEELVCSLERPAEAPDLSEAEKAALAYADISATNHFAISDETFAELRRFFTEPEIVELGLWVGYFIGFGRMVAAWDMSEELPDTFKDKSAKAAPWAGEGFILGKFE